VSIYAMQRLFIYSIRKFDDRLEKGLLRNQTIHFYRTHVNEGKYVIHLHFFLHFRVDEIQNISIKIAFCLYKRYKQNVIFYRKLYFFVGKGLTLLCKSDIMKIVQ